jgi:hypothetical protein
VLNYLKKNSSDKNHPKQVITIDDIKDDHKNNNNNNNNNDEDEDLTQDGEKIKDKDVQVIKVKTPQT